MKAYFYFLFFGMMFLTACGTGDSPEAYADRFCACSEELSKAEVKVKYNRLDTASEEYQKIKADHAACMGEKDPFESRHSKEEKEAFNLQFIQALAKKCPNIARNYGYLEEN